VETTYGTQLVGHKEEVNDMSDVVQALQPHKRGDYFSFFAELKNEFNQAIVIDDSLISSQIRDSHGNLIDDLDISSTNIPGQYLVEKDDTTGWPLGNLEIDLEFLLSAKPKSSPTFTVLIIKDVTQHA